MLGLRAPMTMGMAQFKPVVPCWLPLLVPVTSMLQASTYEWVFYCLVTSYPILSARLPPCNILSYHILCFIHTYFVLSSPFLSSEQHQSVRYDTKLLAKVTAAPRWGEVLSTRCMLPGIAQHAHIAPSKRTQVKAVETSSGSVCMIGYRKIQIGHLQVALL